MKKYQVSVSLSRLLRRPRGVVADVDAVHETCKKGLDKGVVDGGIGIVGFEAALGRVSRREIAVHKHMVPGLVAIGPRLVGLVPALIRQADQVEFDNDPAVMVAFVLNKVAGGKTTATVRCQHPVCKC